MPGAPRHAALDLPTTPPPEFGWHWDVFWLLSRTREYTPSGEPRPISHQELHAWSVLADEPLSPVDLDVIRLLDTHWINSRAQLAREFGE